MESDMKWEYLVIPEVERDRLHQLGHEGWSLVCVGGGPGAPLLYLQRPTIPFRERVTLDQRRAYFLAHGLDD
jgi:hypothetical protein